MPGLRRDHRLLRRRARNRTKHFGSRPWRKNSSRTESAFLVYPRTILEVTHAAVIAPREIATGLWRKQSGWGTRAASPRQWGSRRGEVPASKVVRRRARAWFGRHKKRKMDKKIGWSLKDDFIDRLIMRYVMRRAHFMERGLLSWLDEWSCTGCLHACLYEVLEAFTNDSPKCAAPLHICLRVLVLLRATYYGTIRYRPLRWCTYLNPVRTSDEATSYIKKNWNTFLNPNPTP